MNSFHSLAERVRTSGRPKLQLPMKDSLSYRELSQRYETTPILIDSVFKTNEAIFCFPEHPPNISVATVTSFQPAPPPPPSTPTPAQTSSNSSQPSGQKKQPSFSSNPSSPLKEICQNADAHSESELEQPPPPKQYSSLPVCDFSALKELLRDYLFGRIDFSKSYSLSERELILLKYLLQKKFFYSNCSGLSRRIASITAFSAAQFLHEHPLKKRTQLLKRMIFTKFWKYQKQKGIDVLQKYFLGQKDFDYLAEMNSSRGNIPNSFYQRCFRNQEFKREFIFCCDDMQFWNYCHSKSIKSFNHHFLKWITLLDQLHCEQKTKEAEKRVLLKIKFMSIDSNQERILNLFKLQ